MDAVCERISSKADEQTKDNLGIAVASLFRETRLAEVVLIVRLKVERGDVVEQNPDVPSEQFGGMAYADVLDNLMLAVA